MNSINFGTNDKILIVAPHPDDEMIGCGVLICKYASQIDILFITDGSMGFSDNFPKSEIVRIRKDEIQRALSVLAVNNIIFLDIPDRHTIENKGVIYKVDMTKYTHVFIPNRSERHPDHKAVFSIIKKIKSKQHARFDIFEYEVWTPLSDYNYFLDISDVINTKIKCISQYESQTCIYDYVSMVKGLNMYRGVLTKTHYAEVYNSYHDFLYKVMYRIIRNIIK